MKLYTVFKESDCKFIDLLIGKPFVGADSEWRAQGVNAFSKDGNKGPALL